MINYKKIECDYYSILSHFDYPQRTFNLHCFRDDMFLSQAKELYENSSDGNIKDLALNLSVLVYEGFLLSDKQIGLFKNTYKRFKKQQETTLKEDKNG
jgi:hypothetical protein